MSAKKGRRAKVLTVPQQQSRKGSSNDQMDSPNLSSIDKASFLEGLQQNHGNPLHSTAVEEDLNVPEEDQRSGGKAGRKEAPQTAKTAVKQRGAAVKRKETERDGEKEKEEEEEEKRKRSRRSTGGTRRPVENQQTKKGKKTERETGSGVSGDAAPQEKADPAYKRVLSSEEEEEEEEGDEDGSWIPSPKKATVLSLVRGRKSRTSSSGSASAGPEKATRDQQRRKRRGGGGTEPEVVLEAFLDFCDQYRESVESKAVKQAVDSFSSNVEEQLLEKISSLKEFKILKRENAKVGSSIRTKTQRLLEAKHEQMRAERQAWLLEKEEAQLEVRLADLRRGHAFLHDIRELNRQYLVYRHKHPKEKEMYGASSLPALLLETKHIQGAKHQLGVNNNPLKKQLTKKKTRK